MRHIGRKTAVKDGKMVLSQPSFRAGLVVVAGICLLVEAASNPAAALGTPSDAEKQKAREVVASLNWVKAGETASIETVGQLKVPEGYLFLNPSDTKKLMELMQNPTGSVNEYFFAPKSEKWFTVLSYQPTGYVKDDEKVDADAVLATIKKGTEAANQERQRRGWSPFIVNGWKFPPRYDEASKRLEWAIDGSSGSGSVINYDTRILGRKGVTSVTLVASPENLEPAVAEFKRAIQNFSYVSGERYDEVKPGDKVAQYGLAALITGGAAAVAVKTGLWKVIVGFFVAFWKVIVGAVVAAFAALRGFVRRKNP
jgi:uncharacterized membrane-anchored protein